MDLTWVRYDDLRSAVRNGTPFFIKGACELPRIDWNDLISNLNLCSEINDPVKYLRGSFVMHKTLTTKLDGIARPIRGELRAVYPRHTEYTSHVYSSFIVGGETFGRHKDTADVFFLGILGTTEFEIWDKNNYSLRYIIEVGDVVYIPAGLYHNTTALTPRSGISFGIERGLKF